MRFLVTFNVRESILLSEIASVQNRIGDTIQKNELVASFCSHIGSYIQFEWANG